MRFVVLVLLLNIWTCMKGNQINYWFIYSPSITEEYLQLLTFNNTNNKIKDIEANNINAYVEKSAKNKLEVEDNNDK